MHNTHPGTTKRCFQGFVCACDGLHIPHYFLMGGDDRVFWLLAGTEVLLLSRRSQSHILHNEIFNGAYIRIHLLAYGANKAIVDM